MTTWVSGLQICNQFSMAGQAAFCRFGCMPSHSLSPACTELTMHSSLCRTMYLCQNKSKCRWMVRFGWNLFKFCVSSFSLHSTGMTSEDLCTTLQIADRPSMFPDFRRSRHQSSLQQHECALLMNYVCLDRGVNFKKYQRFQQSIDRLWNLGHDFMFLLLLSTIKVLQQVIWKDVDLWLRDLTLWLGVDLAVVIMYRLANETILWQG